MKLLCRFVFALLFISSSAYAFEPFTVTDIRVEGLQRISSGTVFNYLPIKVGDTIDDGKSALAMRALFKTGYFSDVFLEQDGDVLVVNVRERAAISSIGIKGNEDIETEALLEGLKEIGLAEGRVYNRSLLETVEQELRRQYFSRGKYAVKIDTEVTPLERNRVGIVIDISEGRAARIKQINIVGNRQFEDEQLLDKFSLTTPTFFSFYTKDDQYSKQKLAGDLETLKSYYLDRGYLNFAVSSTQVSITPDKRDIYITINITEGDQYRISEVTLSGDLVVEPEELFPLVRINPGDVFSRKRVTRAVDKISEKLGDQGYAFANVNTVPELDDEANEVALAIFVDPGNRVYVRRVNVSGNVSTRDEVLRREMRQMESGWFSAEKVDRSRTRLQRLGFFEDVNVETPPVPGTPDQVDVNYSVTEGQSGSVTAGLGFSQTSGLLFNASISQNNFLGNGERVSMSFNNSDVSTVYSFNYTNPYHTMDGISRGFGIYFRETDANEANLADYTTDTFGGNVNFGLPINEFDTIRLSGAYENMNLKATSGSTSLVTGFIEEHGDTYDTVTIAASWSHDTRNKAIFADRGGLVRLSGETAFPGSGLEFYKLNYRHQKFFSLTRALTLSLNGELGYGDGYGELDKLPFFENYFAGGSRSIRGFEDNTLGPRDPESGDPIGGSFKVVGNVNLYFPVPFIEENNTVRIGAFFDIGNVFDGVDNFDTGDIRYSVGLSGLWLSPLGPLAISLGFPLNDEADDDVQNFQFNIGSGF